MSKPTMKHHITVVARLKSIYGQEYIDSLRDAENFRYMAPQQAKLHNAYEREAYDAKEKADALNAVLLKLDQAYKLIEKVRVLRLVGFDNEAIKDFLSGNP